MDKQINIYESLTSAELNTYQQLFSFFDKDDSGSIPMASVPMYIRGMGHCPTEAELAKILEQFGAPRAKAVTFNTLVSFLVRRPKEQMIEDELIDAFFGIQASTTSSSEASKNELVQVGYLKRKLAELGQPFSESEIEAFSQFLTQNGLKSFEQEFNYRNLSKILAYGEMQI